MNREIANKIEPILQELGVSNYTSRYSRVSLPCPVHGGDNPEGACLYVGQEMIVPNWKCYTHHCESEVGKNLLCFVAAIRGESVWQTKGWLKVTFGIEDDGTQEDSDCLSFIYSTKMLKRKEKKLTLVPRAKVRQSLTEIPQYYLDRGFSKEVLDKYDVGFCSDSAKPMYNRVVVPIYDQFHENMIGCVGRSIFDKCYLCDKYHNPKSICPISNQDKLNCSKWKNSKGFLSDSYFYNYWFAHPSIYKTGTAFLVEGQSDIWRFAEIEVDNVLGMFGASLKSEQKISLERTGAQRLITFTDPDEAGELCRKKIEEEVGRMYDIQHIVYDKDASDCKHQELLDLVKPYLG